jgi:hypothetical protein
MKNPSKTILTLLVTGFLSCPLFLPQVHAIPITGSVDMSGTVALDSSFLGLATQANSFLGVTVGGLPTGSFTGTFGDSVSWNAFGWNPGAPVPSLWSFSDAGTGYTYTFNLAGVTIKAQDNYFLNLLGAGTLTITGNGSPYDPTAGVWSFTISNPLGGAHSNYTFSFANSQTTVPDGGSAVALLGIALAGLEALRRRLRSA